MRPRTPAADTDRTSDRRVLPDTYARPVEIETIDPVGPRRGSGVSGSRHAVIARKVTGIWIHTGTRSSRLYAGLNRAVVTITSRAASSSSA
jgi:hypothetical protein